MQPRLKSKKITLKNFILTWNLGRVQLGSD